MGRLLKHENKDNWSLEITFVLVFEMLPEFLKTLWIVLQILFLPVGDLCNNLNVDKVMVIAEEVGN